MCRRDDDGTKRLINELRLLSLRSEAAVEAAFGGMAMWGPAIWHPLKELEVSLQSSNLLRCDYLFDGLMKQ
jgi:hypothetical protein